MKKFIIILFLTISVLCFGLDFNLPMKEFIISSECGYRTNPLGGMEYPHLHKGIDLVGPHNAKVFSVAAGLVVEHWLPPNQLPGYKGHETFGGMIVIDHGNGIFTLCGHMSKTYVHEGDYIPAGTWIGNQGKTGKATGEHLHFEFIIDPLQLLTGEIKLTKSFKQFMNEQLYGKWGDR
ncbi:MAG: M23 family metallopeptidase [Candidatus Heimdallarchaeaceae archaeon]